MPGGQLVWPLWQGFVGTHELGAHDWQTPAEQNAGAAEVPQLVPSCALLVVSTHVCEPVVQEVVPV